MAHKSFPRVYAARENFWQMCAENIIFIVDTYTILTNETKQNKRID